MIIKDQYFNIYKRASLACAARLADTSCPPEAPFRRLEVTLVNCKGDNISKYVHLVLKPISLEKSPNLSILKCLMRNDDVITVMSHHFLMKVASYVGYVSIQILLKFQPSISYNG